MIVPQFWAEARLQQARAKGVGQITVRRLGWSEVSPADAQRLADERVREAFDRIVAGEKLPRREPKVPYNGAAGVPIREEVLSRQGDVVITRNGYGAHCLNTPDVLFADVDWEITLACRQVVAALVLLLAGAVVLGVMLRSFVVGGFGVVLAALLAHPLAGGVQLMITMMRGGRERQARRRIDSFVRSHPGWLVRIYQTPAGFRVLAMHQAFDPRSPEVKGFFKALRVDPVYAQMCFNQACFRARVTGKPWRIGLPQHLKPRPGVWPVNPERMPERQRWIDVYEEAAAGFAACRFVDEIGAGATHPKAAAVCELHDRLSQALSGRDIA